jgi:hypothetical protein
MLNVDWGEDEDTPLAIRFAISCQSLLQEVGVPVIVPPHSALGRLESHRIK